MEKKHIGKLYSLGLKACETLDNLQAKVVYIEVKIILQKPLQTWQDLMVHVDIVTINKMKEESA